MASLVVFEDVVKVYAADGVCVPALDGLSLDVEAGEFLSLVGRSGCGKSTLLHLAGAMDFPTAGRVFFEGTDTALRNDAGLTKLRREKVGFIFQNFQLLPTLTVAENVELPLMLAGESRVRDRALEGLARVEMDSFASRYPYQLSGGQMQRVAIARALVAKPRLVLADEPIGNLDSTTGELVLRLLRRIASEEGVAVLMATHSAESTRVTDRVVHLKDGRIVSDAVPA